MSATQPYLSQTEAPTRAEVDAMTGPVLLEFGTDWCGHCRAAQPAIAEALAQHANWQHIKIEDGPGHPLGRRFGVKLWPTLVLVHDGQEIGRLVRPTQVSEISNALTNA
jgi:thioredoxin 1